MDTAAMKQQIEKLKKEKNAVILAHFYQNLEVQDVADVVGDSFALAQKAQTAEQSIIILCGVHFMAESAKLLNPGKTVYIPVPDAGCPMADMVRAEDVLELREKYPQAAVVCYVNSTAEVKAVSDICCTSSSAERIVRSLDEKQIIFVPDQNLGSYIAEKVPEKEVILYPGFCPTHHRVTPESAKAAREKYPEADILVHPECPKEVLKYADYVGSTAGILDRARSSDAKVLIIGTEQGVLDILRRELPEKEIHLIQPEFICPNMKKTGLQDVIDALEGRVPAIELDKAQAEKAAETLERMVRV